MKKFTTLLLIISLISQSLTILANKSDERKASFIGDTLRVLTGTGLIGVSAFSALIARAAYLSAQGETRGLSSICHEISNLTNVLLNKSQLKNLGLQALTKYGICSGCIALSCGSGLIGLNLILKGLHLKDNN